jgi:glycosyltransferase involved in cell wall biosynthesis
VEDFGTVLIEAQAMGCPVIAFAEGGAPDAVQDGVTGVLFHEPSAASIVDAMRRVEALDLDETVLRAHVAQFSTEQFEARLMQVIGKYVA